MKYELIIFDMDGTILNTIEDLTDCANHFCAQYGFKTHTYDEFKFFVGNGIPKMIQRALPKDIAPELYEKILSDYLEYYPKHSAEKTRAYDGIIECIKNLKKAGLTIAVNTNKIESAAIDLCNDYFPNLFDIISGSRKGVPPKPAPDGIFEILEKFGINRKEYINSGKKIPACYIGDSDVDLQTGINSGLDFIGVDWGFRGKDFLFQHGAQKVLETAQELSEYILGKK